MKNRILRPGQNCWRICRADKVSFLIDGQAYFKAVRDSLPLAEQQIMILAWDIYSQLRLVPEDNKDKYTNTSRLGKLLDQLLRHRRQLHVNILSWDFSMLFAMSREWLPIYKLNWSTHRRLKFCLDDQYPLGSSHHQKVVVIDDALAFVGGLDLTRGRWDTPDHRADDTRRQSIDGSDLPIRPYHDIQMAVSGPVATALGTLTRERWQRCTRKKLPIPQKSHKETWPTGLQVDIEDVYVAITRTAPAYGDFVEVREVEQLYIDSIAAAQKYIYIENQYLTAPSIYKALAKQLAESNGPEVVIIMPLNTQGWLSQHSMDIMRTVAIRSLREADHYGRFAVYYPDKPDLGEQSINVHAKIMIIDDSFVRVGSSNLNNRSMGLDSECDLALEAPREDIRIQGAIRHFRNRLLSEHLDCDPDEINERIEKQGSLLGSIESLRGEGRTLSPLEPHLKEPDKNILKDIRLTDPERPVDAEILLNHFVPEKHAKSAGKRIMGWIITLMILLTMAISWRYTPLNDLLDVTMLTKAFAEWRNSFITPLIIIAAFVVGGLLVIPVTAMIIISVLVFGPVLGFTYALLGSVISAISCYGLGSLLGRNAVRQLASKRINQISRQLADRGLLTMLVVRIIPLAPFTIVNLVAGASHIGFRDFVLGTLIGMIPGILGITLLTDRVKATLRSPDWETLLTLVAVATVVFAVGYFISRHLLISANNKGDSIEKTTL